MLMRTAYRGVAHLIMISVIVQAAVIAWTRFGIGEWVQGGGVLTRSVLDDHDTLNFTAQRGAMLHGVVGTLVVPLLALMLLVLSFWVRVPGGVRSAGVVVVLVAIQVVLGVAGHGSPWLGLLHATNAFLILGAAKVADTRVVATAEPTGSTA